jgi:tetratricopeptide (TPR) repeat protein
MAALLLAVLTGCAARARVPAGPTIAEAEQLVTAGCYTCLVDALKVYDAILASRPSPRVTRGAFRTAVLLAAREKELGLPASEYLERARTLASSLGPEEHARLALDIAAALPWDQSGLSKEFAEDFVKTRQAASTQVRTWHEQLQLLRIDPFFAYLDASLACSYGDWRARDSRLDEIASAQPSALIVKYRIGACVFRRRAALEEVLAAEPRFAEAHLFLGRDALVESTTAIGRRSKIEPHLAAAYAAFPKSPSVTFTLGGMYRAFNKMAEALRYYDETLALVAMHREAMLGRIIALTYLGRAADAIATATQMIELGQWYVGDAYYWRAFNLHEQKNLDAARHDVEQAKTLAGLRSDVFLLAGIIYFDRRELDTAARDLGRAWLMNDTACDAAWYLGLVRSEQKQWDVAGALFPKAAACYRSTADILRAQLAEALKGIADQHDRASVDTDYSQTIEQQLVSEARSCYNAAYAFAQLGQREQALEYAQRAEQHPFMKAKAAELIAALKKSAE